MGSVGDAYDNAMCESFFATLECELIERKSFRNQAEARMAVFDFIEAWYNPRRRHSAPGRVSPTARSFRLTMTSSQAGVIGMVQPTDNIALTDMSTNDIFPQKLRPRSPPMRGRKVQVNQALTPIAFEILLSLSSVPRHGYGIKLDVEERTAGEVSLGSGTLYQAIQRLERSGLISETTADRQGRDARRGRSYQLEPAGRAILEGELRRLNRVVEYARSNSLLPDPEAP